MKKLLFVIFIFMQYEAFSQVEYRKYAIKVVGIKVGEILATKTKNGIAQSEYTLTSLVDVNFLVYHLKVDYKVNSKFLGAFMQSSEVIVKSNRGDFYTETQKTKEGYHIKSVQPKKELEKTLTSKINNTFSSIHFNEPVGVTKVYAEFYGDFIRIKDLGNHKYSGVLEDNVDEYYYKNGLLVKAVKKNAITDMVIVFEKSWEE